MTTLPFNLCGFDTSQLRAALIAYNSASKGQFLPNGPFSEWHSLLPSKATKPYPAPSDCFLPHLDIVLVQPPLPGIPTLSMSFPTGVASPTFLFPL